jgi:hypothetical protein
MHIALLFIAGFLLALTMFVVMHRVCMKRFLGYATIVDVVFTIIMFSMFAHSFSGVVAGSVAGLVMAAGLTLGRKIFGYERLVWCKWRWKWKTYSPTWVIPQIERKFNV